MEESSPKKLKTSDIGSSEDEDDDDTVDDDTVDDENQSEGEITEETEGDDSGQESSDVQPQEEQICKLKYQCFIISRPEHEGLNWSYCYYLSMILMSK